MRPLNGLGSNLVPNVLAHGGPGGSARAIKRINGVN